MKDALNYNQVVMKLGNYISNKENTQKEEIKIMNNKEKVDWKCMRLKNNSQRLARTLEINRV